MASILEEQDCPLILSKRRLQNGRRKIVRVFVVENLFEVTPRRKIEKLLSSFIIFFLFAQVIEIADGITEVHGIRVHGTAGKIRRGKI